MLRILLCHCLLLPLFYCLNIGYDNVAERENFEMKIENVDGTVNKKSDVFKILQRIRRGLQNNDNTTSSRLNFTSTTPTAKTTVTLPKNNTEYVSRHKYYVSTYKSGISANSPYFKDLRVLKNNNNTNVTLTLVRPKNPESIQYFIQNLKFVFPFYGHEVSRVVVMSSGFLHIGPIVHNFAHDVHYVAPLMANFTPIGNRTSNIYTYDDGDRFIAQWDSVLEAKENATDPFTFQVSIFKNGTIYFAYQKVPYSVSQIDSHRLETKVGLADGYIYQYYIYLGRIRYGPFRIVFRYNMVTLPKEKVTTNSVYILTPIPNCISAKSCNACFSEEIAKNFQCKWCPKIQLCSDSFDWHRQRWNQNGCPLLSIKDKATCNAPPTSARPRTTHAHLTLPYFTAKTKTAENHGNKKPFKSNKDRKKKNSAGVVIGVLVVLIVLVLAGILFYGYRNPNTQIGMFMIRYRPSKLFRRV